MSSGASVTLWLLGSPDALTIGTSRTGGGESAGDWTVVAHQTGQALGQEGSTGLIPVCSCWTLGGNDRLDRAVVPRRTNQTVVLCDPIQAPTVSSRFTGCGSGGSNPTVLSHGACKTVHESYSPCSGPISSSSAVDGVNRAQDAVVARVTGSAIRGLLCSCSAAVCSCRALGRRGGCYRAVITHRTDKTV